MPGTPKHKHEPLTEAFATAICGNDIMSSCLYVSGIAILFAGVYAPLILLSIGGILFLYKKVYTEVVEALPVNGGVYNCLLNATSKPIAATAGVMTFLSYIATAVISAKIGVEYINRVFSFEKFVGDIPTPEPVGITIGAITTVTIITLFLFALLVISGVKDSARVALGIFSLHLVTLSLFLILGAISFLQGDHSYFTANIAKTGMLLKQTGNTLWFTLYLAFSASLLGVSGFESSANFVEEQAKGVFRKTLRNMLLGVAVFNPLIALVVLHAMPYQAIVEAKDFLLAEAALSLGGRLFSYLVSIDAFLVLAGAVLTSYIGVSGLLYRMSSDSCIPLFFRRENARGSFPRIVISFFLLCSSILLITEGNLLSLAGVYTIAFLGVMTFFALGNLILKESRTDLKRTYRAPVLLVVIAFLATLFGIFGNIRIDPRNLMFFELYFIPSLGLVFLVIFQDYIFKFLLRLTAHRFPYLHRYIQMHFSDLTEGKLVAFIHRPDRLRKILQYIDRNETGRNISLVYCLDKGNLTAEKALQDIKSTLPHIQKAGFFPYFTISLLVKDRPFGPKVIHEVAKELGIHKNRILIGAIHDHHHFDYSALGGVRIIFG